MMAEARGRHVAVVGRAASIAGSGNGAAIEACDVVVRVNWLLPFSGHAGDVGARTDLLYHCNRAEEHREAADRLGVTARKVDTGLRKRLAKSSRLDHRRYRPTTGVVAIFDALEWGAEAVMAFGFDLYATGYSAPAAGNPTKAVVRAPLKWKHDHSEDVRLLRRLMETEPRFVPDARLSRVLEAA